MFITLSLGSSNNIYIKSETQEVIFAMQLSDAAFTDYLLVRIFLIAWRYFSLQPPAWKRNSHIYQNTRSDANGFCITQLCNAYAVNACDLSERCTNNGGQQIVPAYSNCSTMYRRAAPHWTPCISVIEGHVHVPIPFYAQTLNEFLTYVFSIV